MASFKYLVVFGLVLAVTSGQPKSLTKVVAGKVNQVFKKPYPVLRSEELSKSSPKSSEIKPELQKNPLKDPLREDTFIGGFSDALLADPIYIPSVKSGRALDLEGAATFHEDNSFEDSSHLEEDHDLSHKLRTARALRTGPQNLAEFLGQLHAAQGINTHNGAAASDFLSVNASGTDISVANSGNSLTSGTGEMTASGTVSINNSYQ